MWPYCVLHTGNCSFTWGRYVYISNLRVLLLKNRVDVGRHLLSHLLIGNSKAHPADYD